MPDILIRDVSEETLRQIKALAKRHRRSLQQEVRHLLESVSRYAHHDVYKRALRIRKRLMKSGVDFTDSARLIRKDRGRWI
jgi:plasmid stability protein